MGDSITAQGRTVITGTLQSAAGATGNGDTLRLPGTGSVTFTVSGTFSATVTFEATADGTNYDTLNVVKMGTSTVTTTATATGLYRANVASLLAVRARISAFTSGNVTVTAVATLATLSTATGSGTGTGSDQVQGAAADNAAAAGNPVRTGAKYNSSTQTYADGDVADTQADVNGNTKVVEQYAPVAEDNTNGVIGYHRKPVTSATYALSNAKDAGTVTKANVKATPGMVYRFFVTNTNAAARYFQLHNKATAPAAAETAQRYFVIPAGTAAQPAILELMFDYGVNFTTGIGWAISTTASTFTDSATASDHMVDIGYF